MQYRLENRISEGKDMYQKEIIYLGLYKDGSRIGNAGFLKVENKGQASRLDLKLRNIPYNIRGKFPIRIYDGNGWKEINGISVQEGGGNWEENAADPTERVQIQIMLPGGYFLEGKSKNAQPAPVRMKEDPQGGGRTDMTIAEEETKPRAEGTTGEESRYGEEKRTAEESRYRPEESTAEENRYRSEKDMSPKPETVIITEELPRPAKRETNGQSGIEAQIPETYSLKEDKWEQILDSYERIHPYGDERVYVKLEPKDFIILQSKYQHLVNNSFLLHGFYNYRYIILGKENDYYLGVPGVFYEREKMVALMFGFEAFECPGGIARAGEFGYYLRKVEL